ncbi:MAG: hypothetical protein MUC41_03655 [Syntrophobacteraceae bacterium]|nr:hypothetical protein [Syntrophobacteraceae bacterium]
MNKTWLLLFGLVLAVVSANTSDAAVHSAAPNGQVDQALAGNRGYDVNPLLKINETDSAGGSVILLARRGGHKGGHHGFRGHRGFKGHHFRRHHHSGHRHFKGHRHFGFGLVYPFYGSTYYRPHYPYYCTLYSPYYGYYRAPYRTCY